MRVGIMGGTFDPIHMGHLIAAEQVRDEHKLEEIWFLPAHVPPHKEQALAADWQRCEMVAQAIAGHPAFRLSTLELDRTGVSYTVNTARELANRFPEHTFHFIIGADMVNDLPKWYQIEEIVQHLSFIGLTRAGVPWRADALPDWLKAHVVQGEMPHIGLSSTQIRERCRNRQSIRYLVPAEVERYIKESRLYEE
ncbi:nicotinate-nucleotide adenylyltransferase [Marinicrinis sediminis]|uniref:Probable nicotinate-nucleotide adenylyltransferase n=1 Tax=Marinicrinis sediminis TaxID=1652465 RepID=A0ABW5R9M2_9BACL